jgi:polyisoprenoid-binding protein YceI
MANTVDNTNTQQTGTGTGTGAGKVTVWTLDPAHMNVEFSGRHMMVSTVRGRFAKATGTINLDESDYTKSWVLATIDASSLESGVERRDDHLRSQDFLHVEQYPDITFKSTRIEHKGGDEYKVYGDLTIRDVTKEVVLDTTLGGRAPSMRGGGEVMGFDATTTINRKDWGLGWNVALETGGVLVSEKIKITLEFEAIKQS